MKQETLEEAIEKYAEIYRCPATNTDEYCKHDIISAINFGAKWQAKISYSEEELREAFNKGMTFERGEYQSENTYNEFTGFQKPNKELSFEKWFNQFKKK
jgi:hypothetical protein